MTDPKTRSLARLEAALVQTKARLRLLTVMVGLNLVLLVVLLWRVFS